MSEKKKILIIIGHPGHERLSHQLAERYAAGARSAGAEVKVCALDQLRFDPILHDGYARIQALEPDLTQAQQDILWADHIVTVYPIWWGSYPALMKGFVDRVFLPRVFFQFEKGKIFPRQLLRGRSGRVIVTLDTGFYLGRLGVATLHYLVACLTTWRFVGIRPLRFDFFGPVVTSSPERRVRWLGRVYRLGERQK